MQKIKKVLEQRANQYIPSTRVFNELDLDVIIDSMKLKEKAEQRGICDQPLSESTELDSVKTEIINVIEGEKNRN